MYDNVTYKTNVRAADPLAEHVRKFCQTVKPGTRPVHITIRPRDGCEPLDCFCNVQKQVAKYGGRIQFGWAIWEWPRVYIEAEHHAVYDPGNGQSWIDVTPSTDGDSGRAFLPDNQAIYDFTNEGIRHDNIRQALHNDPNIREFFLLAARTTEIMNSLPGVGKIQLPKATAEELAALEMSKSQLLFQIGIKHTGRNGPCFCRSGQKFKKCHGRGVQ